MKQFLIHLSWYENDKIAVIKAKNKIKAIEKLIMEQINWNKKENEYDYFNDLPLAYYDEDLTERQNTANYFKLILNKEIGCKCFEINENTDAIIQWRTRQGYKLEQIGE